MKPKLVVILGPTAIGKSALVLELAAQLNCEIISADSQQVYRYMDIGTAKSSKEQRQKISHHLIDVVDPDEEFSAAMFRHLATDSVHDIAGRGKNIIVCGGTGLYIKALTRGLFVGPGRDLQIRQALDYEIEQKGLAALYERLEQIDPASAMRIHPNDRQRVARALEVYESTGRRISEWQKEHGFKEGAFDVLKIGLDRERAELYALIDRRCESMVRAGLVEEVRGLIQKGYLPELKSMQSVGYRHIGWFVEGQMALNDAVELMKRDTRRLAKRQLTWFRGDPEIRWLHPGADEARIKEAVEKFLDAN